jgi:hypothetical protein
MNLSKTILAIAIACTLGFAGEQAKAAQINGLLNIEGTATFDTTSLGSASSVVSFDAVTVGGGNTGDFLAVAPGTAVAMASPYVFNPSTSTPLLWSVGGFTFSLTASSVDFQTNTFLAISGTGIILGGGFDPTPGVWAFTSQAPDGMSHPTFTFSAGTVAVPSVPEGGMTVALLGAGLIGLVFFRAKFAKV